MSAFWFEDELVRAMEGKESQDADATNFLAAIVDTKPLTSGSLPPEECARPGLHAFLEAVYPYYDSKCVQYLSATPLKWYTHGRV